MSEPGKGTHWSNLISILGVGGKKSAEPAPEATPAMEAAPPPAAAPEAPTAGAAGSGAELQIDWGKPIGKKRSAEPKPSAPARGKLPAAGPAGEKGGSAARPAAAPAPKRKHWGSLAEQLGLPPREPEVIDEPTWIEEAEQNGSALSGDDAADECVSHPGGAVCAPEECEARAESCKMRPPQEEVLDTRDTEFLDDGPASDDDLDALADLINEGIPASEAIRSPRRDEEEDVEEVEGRGRESREEGGEPRRRRRRRGRGRGRREEGGEERVVREPGSRESGAREPGRRETSSRVSSDEGRYGRDEGRYDDRDEELDLELGRDDEIRELEEELDEVRGEASAEARRPGRDEAEGADERGGRRRRRRRRRRGSEEAVEGARPARRELEPQDRVRSGDLEYRRGKGDEDFEDDADGEESVGAHRNLPTWEDALGAIIGGNMENRARSPQPPHGGGRRGGGGRDRDRDRGRDHERGGRDRGGDRYSDRGPDRGSDRGPRRDDRR